MSRPRKSISEKRKAEKFNFVRDGGKQNPESRKIVSPLPPPADFDKVAKEIFLRLQVLLIDLGVYEAVDVIQIEMAARAYSLYVACHQEIIKISKTVPKYLMESVAQKIQPILYTVGERNLSVYRHITERFGMSPVDRTRVTVPLKEKKSEVEEFMDEDEKDLGID